jgi:tetratricopeptide (TPR) repeat protein
MSAVAGHRATATLALVLFAAAVALHAMQPRADIGALGEGGEQLLYIQSPQTARHLALSYDSLLADIYWIRALQYFGSTRLSNTTDKRYPLLYPLLDFTTSLDPHFDIAYRFGAIFLAEPEPGGAGRPDQALALLQKGLRTQPDKWQFAHDIGFIYYWWLRDYPAAAEWFGRASKLPDSPNWLPVLAAVVLARGGERASSRQLWEGIRNDASLEEYLRNQATFRLQQLDALDQLDALQRLTARYAMQYGKAASSWNELGRAGYLRQVPVDPSGTPYEIDPTDGVVRLSPDSRLNPLPMPEVPR